MKDTQTASVYIMVLLILLAGPSSSVSAAVRQFIPKISDYSAELEIDAAYSNDENKSGGKGLKHTDFFSRERINFYLFGYVYHPRFIQYSLELSAGLKQENYQSNAVDTGWTNGTSTGYYFKAIVLPEHPYNLELFARRYEPLTQQALSRQSPSVTYTKGAIFRYKQKPYFGNLSYIDTTTESATSTYYTTAYNASGSYYKEYASGNLLTLSGAYDHRDSSSSVSDFKGLSDEATLNNNITFRNAHLFRLFLENVTLGSSLRYASIRQGGAGSKVNDDIFNWAETLNASLPWNFYAGLVYSFSKSKTDFEVPPQPSTELSSTNNYFSFDISHKLYASLYTNYRFAHSSQSNPSGDSKATSNTLGIHYTKYIPWGRMNAGGSYGVTVTDNTGTSASVRETRSGVAVPGSIVITNGQDVDLDSLTVFVKNPEPPNELFALVENVDYTVSLAGSQLRIDIFNLPSELFIPGDYDFLIYYSLLLRNVELETKYVSYNIEFNLFNDLIMPYYNHYSSKQTVVSGSFSGEPLDETSDTVGINANKPPFFFLFEYQNVRANINPQKGWKTELRYLKDLTLTSRIQAKARYSNTDYPSGTGDNGVPYTEKKMGVDVGFQKRFPKRNIAATVNGGYSRLDGLSKSDVYSFSGFLSWKTRKLLLTVGATASSFTSEYLDIKTSRLSQYYFINIKRQLF